MRAARSNRSPSSAGVKSGIVRKWRTEVMVGVVGSGNCSRVDGGTEGRQDGRTAGRQDGRTAGRQDGRTELVARKDGKRPAHQAMLETRRGVLLPSLLPSVPPTFRPPSSVATAPPSFRLPYPPARSTPPHTPSPAPARTAPSSPARSGGPSLPRGSCRAWD